MFKVFKSKRLTTFRLPFGSFSLFNLIHIRAVWWTGGDGRETRIRGPPMAEGRSQQARAELAESGLVLRARREGDTGWRGSGCAVCCSRDGREREREGETGERRSRLLEYEAEEEEEEEERSQDTRRKLINRPPPLLTRVYSESASGKKTPREDPLSS